MDDAIDEWNDPYACRDVSLAEEVISDLERDAALVNYYDLEYTSKFFDHLKQIRELKGINQTKETEIIILQKELTKLKLRGN